MYKRRCKGKEGLVIANFSEENHEMKLPAFKQVIISNMETIYQPGEYVLSPYEAVVVEC